MSVFPGEWSRMLCGLALGLGLCWTATPVAAEDSLPEGLVLKEPVIPDHITGVLREVNQQLSRDLRPSDNAVVLLLQLFGEETFEDPLGEPSMAMLGVAELSKSGPRMIYAGPFLKSRPAAATGDPVADSQTLELQLGMAGERPWEPVDYPLLDEYLNQNRAALDLVLVATKKPRYFAPMLSPDTPPRLLSPSLVIERRLAYLAFCLTARGMRHWQAGEHAAAFEQFLACHHLAYLLASGSPFDVSLVKAQNIQTVGYRAIQGLITSGQFTGPLADEYRQKLDQLPKLPTAVNTANVGERWVLHQELEFLKTDKGSVEEFFEEIPEARREAIWKQDIPNIHWDVALKRADEIQQQYVDSLAQTDRAKQAQQFVQLDEQFAAWNEGFEAAAEKFSDTKTADVDAASRWIGESMARSLQPWYRQRQLMQDQATVRRDFVQLGLALEAYYASHKEYPADLAALSPSPFKTIPQDVYSQRPFLYERIDPHFARLTCWGADTVNNAGQRYNDDVILELKR